MNPVRRTAPLSPADEEGVVTELRIQFHQAARGHQLPWTGAQIRTAADQPARCAGRRRRPRLAVVAPLAAAATVLAILLATGTLGGTQTAHPPAAATQCHSAPVHAPLPTWARAGFTPPNAPANYVWGQKKRLVAILFGPLSSPPAPGRNNKILWVVRDPNDAMPAHVVARSSVSDATSRLTLPGGPGPSLIDVAAPGCWRFTVTWPGGSDTVDLDYRPRS